MRKVNILSLKSIEFHFFSSTYSKSYTVLWLVVTAYRQRLSGGMVELYVSGHTKSKNDQTF